MLLLSFAVSLALIAGSIAPFFSLVFAVAVNSQQPCLLIISTSSLFTILNVYLFLTERERERERERARTRMSGGGAEREGDSESEAGSRVPAVCTEPNVGFKLTNHEIMT